MLRRLDCVLADTKEKVLRMQRELRDKKLENLDPQLRKVAGFAFYNTSRYSFEAICEDAPHVAANLRNYIAGFSPNMRGRPSPLPGCRPEPRARSAVLPPRCRLSFRLEVLIRPPAIQGS